MQHSAFETPVRVFVGLGMPRDIGTAFQAYMFLKEMPRDRHRLLHAGACEACLSALTQAGDATEARRALVAYAETAGMLAPEFDEIVAANAAIAPMRLAG